MLEMTTRLRDRALGGNAPYVQWRVYANGSYCYTTTSVGVTAAAKPSVESSSTDTCASGWHQERSIRGENGVKDGAWVNKRWQVPVKLDQNSMRLAVRPCEDRSVRPTLDRSAALPVAGLDGADAARRGDLHVWDLGR